MARGLKRPAAEGVSGRRRSRRELEGFRPADRIRPLRESLCRELEIFRIDQAAGSPAAVADPRREIQRREAGRPQAGKGRPGHCGSPQPLRIHTAGKRPAAEGVSGCRRPSQSAGRIPLPPAILPGAGRLQAGAECCGRSSAEKTASGSGRRSGRRTAQAGADPRREYSTITLFEKGKA